MNIQGKVDLKLYIADILNYTAAQVPRSGSTVDTMVENTGNSDEVMLLTDSTLGRLLEELGIQDNPQNRAMTLFALLQGIPLNEKNLNYLIGKKFKTSILYKTLIEKGLENGYSHEVEDLKSSFPRLETLASFIENIDKNIELAENHISKLCKLLLKDNKNWNARNLLGDLLSGMLFQLDNKLPFHMVQIPLKIKDDIYPSEIWIDKGKDIFYLEIVLPKLKTIGCLVKDWNTSLGVTFYCQGEFIPMIKNRLQVIEKGLNNLGLKCESIEVSDMSNENGLHFFLSRYDVQYQLVDISI